MIGIPDLRCSFRWAQIRPHVPYNETRKTMRCQPSVRDENKETDGSQIHSRRRQLRRWKGQFRKRFSCLIVKVDLLLTLVSVPMQTDNSFPSEIRGIWELGFLCKHKAIVPDDPSKYSFKDGNEMLTPELTNSWDQPEHEDRFENVGMNR